MSSSNKNIPFFTTSGEQIVYDRIVALKRNRAIKPGAEDTFEVSYTTSGARRPIKAKITYITYAMLKGQLKR